MSPRAYRIGRRVIQIDAVRERVLDAAWDLLVESTRFTGFTIDAVAQRAGVARATVYYQFGSKSGVIEALCDRLVTLVEFQTLEDVFEEPDPHMSVRKLVEAFGEFWTRGRALLRRLRAIAVLDADVGRVIAERDDRLRTALAHLVERVPHRADTLTVLHSLIRFEMFDALAGADHEPIDVVPTVMELVEAALAAAAL